MLVILISIFTLFWYFKNSEIYYVSQSEVDALLYLRGLPDGKVLVYDKECLGCEWNTTGKPAVFANKRSYIQNFGNKRTVVDQEIFETRERTRAKELFNATGAKYIYLAAYEGYKENMPFSPGDLGVEKIYSNANGEVWRVK